MNNTNITETGPKTGRDLQKQNNSKYVSAEEITDWSKFDSGVGFINPSSSIKEGYTQSPLMRLSGGKDYWGSSMWDDTSVSAYDWENNLSDIRANNLPWYAKALAGTLKGVGLAGTTFIGGTVGLLEGVVRSIVELDASRIWDNETTQAMDAFNKAMEEALPNYYTQDELENPMKLTNLLSANSIFDKAVKNIGFMVGAAYSGGIYSKAIGAIARGLSTVGKAGKHVIKGKKAVDAAISRGMTSGNQISAAALLGERVVMQSNATRYSKMLVGSVFSGVAEGTVEAVSNSNDAVIAMRASVNSKELEDLEEAGWLYDNALKEGKSEEEALEIYNRRVAEIKQAKANALTNIETYRQEMGDRILAVNIPLLSLDNLFMFGKMYAGGFKALRNLNRGTWKLTKEARQKAKEALKNGDKSVKKRMKALLKDAKKHPENINKLSIEDQELLRLADPSLFSTKVGTALRIITPPIREGLEEMTQAWTSESVKTHYMNKMDYIYDSAIRPESAAVVAEYVGDWNSSIMEGFKNTFGNKNRWEEFLIGAIMGGLGSPTLGRQNNSSDLTWLGRGKLIGLTGGSYVGARDYYRERLDRAKVYQIVEDIIKNPKTVAKYKHVISQVSFAEDMRIAALKEDKKSFKDAETAAIFEEIMYLKRAGELDTLKKLLWAQGEFTDLDIDDIIDKTSSLIAPNVPGNVASLYDEKEKIIARRRKALEKWENLGEKANAAIQAGDTLAAEVLLLLLDVAIAEYDMEDALLVAVGKLLSRAKLRLVEGSSFDFTPEMSQEEKREVVRGKLKGRVNYYNKLIDDISTTMEKIDLGSNEIYSDEQLAALTWYSVMERQWELRGSDILSSLEAILSKSGVLELLSKYISSNVDYLESAGLTGAVRMIESLLGMSSSQILNLQKLLQNITENPTMTMRLMAEGAKVTLKDALGKETTKEYLDWVHSTLTAAVQSLLLADNDLLLKDINDLRDIALGIREYNKLFLDFRKNPGKIERVHNRQSLQALRLANDSLYERVRKSYNLEDPNSILKALDKYASELDKIGGHKAFLASLPAEERAIVVKALSKRKGKEGAKKKQASKDSAIDTASKEIGDASIDNGIEDLNEVIEEKALEMAATMEKDPIAQQLLAQGLEQQLTDAVSLYMEEVASLQLEEEARLLRDIKAFEEADKKELQGLELASQDGNQTSELEEIEVLSNTEEEDFAPMKEASVFEDALLSEESFNNYKKELEKEYLESLKTRTGATGYGNRRALTQYHLRAKDGLTLYEFYNTHREEIPKGVDLEEFLHYIKTVTEYLEKQGAFTRISNINPEDGILVGEPITFRLNEELSKEAGVPVVVIYNEAGKVLGTLRTKLDFDAYREEVKNGTRSLDSSIEEQEELYNRVIKESQLGNHEGVPSTVKSLLAGSLPLSMHNNRVSEIFEEETPIIGICREAGIITVPSQYGSIKINTLMFSSIEPGQVFVLIKTNNGTYIPARCFSLKIKDLAVDDAYVQDAVDTFFQLLKSSTELGFWKHKFLKKMRLSKFNVNYVYAQTTEDGKTSYTETDTAEGATHLRVRLPDPNDPDKQKILTIALKDEDGNWLSEDELRQKAEDFVINTARILGVHVNVDLLALEDDGYANVIKLYLITNLRKGIDGLHTLNDGFTYTSVTGNNPPRTAASPTKTESEGSTITIIIHNGKDYTLDAAGNLRDTEGNLIEDESEKNAVLKRPTTPISSKDSLEKPELDASIEGTELSESPASNTELSNIEVILKESTPESTQPEVSQLSSLSLKSNKSKPKERLARHGIGSSKKSTNKKTIHIDNTTDTSSVSQLPAVEKSELDKTKEELQLIIKNGAIKGVESVEYQKIILAYYRFRIQDESALLDLTIAPLYTLFKKLESLGQNLSEVIPQRIREEVESLEEALRQDTLYQNLSTEQQSYLKLKFSSLNKSENEIIEHYNNLSLKDKLNALKCL